MPKAAQMLFDGTYEEPALKTAPITPDELQAMRKAMVKEDGLLNFTQAATLLGISRPRVSQLVHAGIFRRFTFCDHHYVSYREVKARREADVKGGRPKRNVVERVKVGVKAALQHDRPQMKQGGFRGHIGRKK